MNILIEGLFNKHPKHAAKILESFPHEVFVQFLHETHADVDKILPYLSTLYLAQVLKDYNQEVGHHLCECMTPNLSAMVLRHVEPQARITLLNNLKSPHRKVIELMIDFDPNQLGYYCETDEITLLSDHTVQEALSRIEQSTQNQSFLVVLNKNSTFRGILDLTALIKNRDHSERDIGNFVVKPQYIFSGATRIDHILNHPAWIADLKIPVIGLGQIYLGVISKSMLSDLYRKHEPLHSQRNPVEDYFEFSEMLWGGLQKFWSSIR